MRVPTGLQRRNGIATSAGTTERAEKATREPTRAGRDELRDHAERQDDEAGLGDRACPAAGQQNRMTAAAVPSAPDAPASCDGA